jgi:hypothetical protein
MVIGNPYFLFPFHYERGGFMNMKAHNQLVIAMVLFSFIALVCPPVFAEDTGRKSHPMEAWEFQLSPYFWMPSIDADATVKGQTSSVDLGFGDILKNFSVFGLSGRCEAWKGNWGFMFDGLYTHLNGDFSTPAPDIEVTIEQAVLDFALGYRSRPIPLKSDRDLPALRFTIFGGLRYNYLYQGINLRFKRPIIPVSGVVLSGSASFVEPLLQCRLGLRLTEKFTLLVRGDVGGFGFVSGSNLDWNVLVGFDYRFNRKVSAKIGYRVYGIDYERGSGNDRFGFSGVLYGPMLAMTFYL